MSWHSKQWIQPQRHLSFMMNGSVLRMPTKFYQDLVFWNKSWNVQNRKAQKNLGAHHHLSLYAWAWSRLSSRKEMMLTLVYVCACVCVYEFYFPFLLPLPIKKSLMKGQHFKTLQSFKSVWLMLYSLNKMQNEQVVPGLAEVQGYCLNFKTAHGGFASFLVWIPLCKDMHYLWYLF